MNSFDEDEALARLRAADPATGAHPDLQKVSEHLRGRTPLGTKGAQGYSFSDSSEVAVRVHDPAVRTGRGGLLVAAAVASLALGAGGYALGVNTAPDTPPEANSSGPGSVSGGQTGPGSATSERPGLEDYASVETGAEDSGSARASTDEGSDSAMSEGGGYAGPVIPVAGTGLSTERTTGAVYGVAGTGEQSDDALSVLGQYADGLGIKGTVTDDDFSASVIDATDARSLNVYIQSGTTSVDYSNPALDPWCEEMKQDWADSGSDSGWFGPGGPLPEDFSCIEPGPVPDDATAIGAVQEFLTEAGVDYSGYEFTTDPMFGNPEAYSAEGDDGASATSMPFDEDAYDVPVTVTSTESPLPGYRSWNFSVTSNGVSYANFQLGDFVELGDYPVISPAEAVERANDATFQQLGAYIPELEYGAEYREEWVEPKPLPPVSPGEPIPYPVTESAVTKAELHTGVVSLWDGTEYIVPVYDLADGDGNHWQVLGLADEALNFTP